MVKRGNILFVASVTSHILQFHMPYMELLHANGYQVEVAARVTQPEHVTRLVDKGMNIHDIKFARSPVAFDNLVAWRELAALFLRRDYALVHTHTPMASLMARLIAKKHSRAQVLYTAHGFHFFKGAPIQNWLLYRSAEKVAARYTDSVIVMNQEDLQNAVRLGYKLGETLHFTPGVGVPIEQYAKGSPPVDLLETVKHRVVFTCVAEINANKNHSFLLDVWGQFSRICPGVVLLIAGVGPLRGTLEELCSKRGLDNVRFLGRRQDIPDLLSVTDVFVSMSKREGLPRSILEAMAAGKPILASKIRGHVDLVDARNGRLVPLGNKNALFAALVELARDEDLRTQLGRESAHKVQPYALANVLEEMADIYGALLRHKIVVRGLSREGEIR